MFSDVTGFAASSPRSQSETKTEDNRHVRRRTEGPGCPQIYFLCSEGSLEGAYHTVVGSCIVRCNASLGLHLVVALL